MPGSTAGGWDIDVSLVSELICKSTIMPLSKAH